MNDTKKVLLIFIGVLLLAAGVFAAYRAYGNYDQQSALSAALAWGNLASLPPHNDLKIEKTGSAMTREFTITFSASKQDIRAWLKQSVGTAEVTPQIDGDIEKYAIKPAQGAQFAEVLFNTKLNIVTIHVYWS